MGRLQNIIDSYNKNPQTGKTNPKDIDALKEWIKTTMARIDDLETRVAAIEKIKGEVQDGN
jgi:hypothetical protein